MLSPSNFISSRLILGERKSCFSKFAYALTASFIRFLMTKDEIDFRMYLWADSQGVLHIIIQLSTPFMPCFLPSIHSESPFLGSHPHKRHRVCNRCFP